MATEETENLEDWSKRSNILPERVNKRGKGKNTIKKIWERKQSKYTNSPLVSNNYIVKINTETLFNQITKEEFRSIFLAKERHESLSCAAQYRNFSQV